MVQELNISKNNIEGIIIDTRNSIQFTGDFEWICNVNNGYVTKGSAIHIPRMRDFNYSKDIVMGTSSHTRITMEFIQNIEKYPIIGFADSIDELTTKLEKHT